MSLKQISRPATILLAAAIVFAGTQAIFAQAQPKLKRVPITPARSLDGKDLFVQYCSACHGEDAKGTGPAAPAMKKAPADLTQIAKRNNGTFNKLMVQDSIAGSTVIAAHGNRDMPVWGPVFRTTADPGKTKLMIFNLTTHLESIQAR